MSNRPTYLCIAERQFGLVSVAQLRACGLNGNAIGRRVANGQLERVLSGVYRVAGAPVTYHQRAMAHLLWLGEGSALSHRCAARLWGWDPFCQSILVELISPKDLRGGKGASIHHGELARREIGLRGPLRVTSPARTIVDLAAVASEEQLEIALDCGLTKSNLTVTRVCEALERAGRKGRKGAGELGRLVALRRDGSPLGTSPLEVRFVRLVRRHKLARPSSQHPIVLNGRRYLLDFAYPERKLAIEVDGYRWHASRERFESDRDKGNALTLIGWRLLRITHRQLNNEAQLVLQLRQALGEHELSVITVG